MEEFNLNKYDPNMLKALDVLGELFSIEKMAFITDDFINIYESYKNKPDYNKIETKEERIYNTLFFADKYVGRPDPIKFAVDQIGKLNMQEVYMLSQNIPQQSVKGNAFANLLENKNYLDQMFSVIPITDSEKQRLKELLVLPDGDSEIMRMLDTEQKQKVLLIYTSAASLQKMYDNMDSSTDYTHIEMARASKVTVEHYMDDYRMWEGCGMKLEFNPAYLMLLFKEAISNIEAEKDMSKESLVIYFKIMTLCCFMNYLDVYSDISAQFNSSVDAYPVTTIRK